jgi:hypothetical protein
MKLSYLPANSRFAFTLGDALVRLVNRHNEPQPMFFASRRAAAEAADGCGLKVTKSGAVIAPGESASLF